jgi:hypothetical protein
MNNSQLLLLKHYLNDVNSGHTSVLMAQESITTQNLILAQNVRDPKVLEQMQKAWNNFVDSGQIWAMIIGIIVGYMFKSLTTY